uniref:AB hydrolase-1 domain-containing protein n=1 Tax=Rhizophora mucronata TaxID=61149 RepID=A0A2P2LNL0_RHIMU
MSSVWALCYGCQEPVQTFICIVSALLEAARKINFSDISRQIADGFVSERWDKPILLAWGIQDKYLSQSVAEEFQKGNPDMIKLKLIEGAGHMPQEDWPEKVVDALRLFF